MIKAIETVYKGYRFRSRLEARWAVFFDALGLEWQYEPEGFNIDDDTKYLPDFFIADLNLWVEIKPTIPDVRVDGIREYEICQKLAISLGLPIMLIGGYPGFNCTNPEWIQYDYNIALFLPDMMIDGCGDGVSPNGICSNYISVPDLKLREKHYTSSARLYGFLYEKYGHLEDFPERGDAHGLIELDRKYWQSEYGGKHPGWIYGICQDGLIFQRIDIERKIIMLDIRGWSSPSDDILSALTSAKQARFEHGQVGAPSEWKK